MEGLSGSWPTNFLRAPGAGTPKPFIFNVSGLNATECRAVVDAVVENFPPLVRHVGRVTAGIRSADFAASRRRPAAEAVEQTGVGGRWVVCSPTHADRIQVASADELARTGQDGWVCVQDTYPSPAGAGELRRLFGRRVFSVALLAPGAGVEQLQKDHPEARAARYMVENPSLATPEGEMQVFDLLLVEEGTKASVRKILRVFENRFLEY